MARRPELVSATRASFGPGTEKVPPGDWVAERIGRPRELADSRQRIYPAAGTTSNAASLTAQYGMPHAAATSAKSGVELQPGQPEYAAIPAMALSFVQAHVASEHSHVISYLSVPHV